jgi:hypothetical protein
MQIPKSESKKFSILCTFNIIVSMKRSLILSFQKHSHTVTPSFVIDRCTCCHWMQECTLDALDLSTTWHWNSLQIIRHTEAPTDLNRCAFSSVFLLVTLAELQYNGMKLLLHFTLFRIILKLDTEACRRVSMFRYAILFSNVKEVLRRENQGLKVYPVDRS